MDSQTNDSQVATAIGCWENKQRLEKQLYTLYLRNKNLTRFSYPLDKFKKDYADWEKHPHRKRIQEALTAPSEILYQNNPKRAGTIRAARSLRVEFLILALTFMLVIPGTLLTVLFMAITAPIFAFGTVNYQMKATNEYFQTPKTERTALQKFNMWSSLPSTILAFSFSALLITASFAVPGALLAALTLGGFWLAYKACQNAIGHSLKWHEYKKVEQEFKQENTTLEGLRKDPLVDLAIRERITEKELDKLTAGQCSITLNNSEKHAYLGTELSTLKERQANNNALNHSASPHRFPFASDGYNGTGERVRLASYKKVRFQVPNRST